MRGARAVGGLLTSDDIGRIDAARGFLDRKDRLASLTDVGEAGEAILAVEEAARRVNAPYIIAGEQTADGPRPAHIKDRIRALGPTVRPDLTLKPADPAAGDWVI